MTGMNGMNGMTGMTEIGLNKLGRLQPGIMPVSGLSCVGTTSLVGEAELNILKARPCQSELDERGLDGLSLIHI